MDEKIDQLNPHEIDEAEALYRASKLENCMNDVCRGINNYLRLYPENPDAERWKELYRESNAIRDQYKKLREVL